MDHGVRAVSPVVGVVLLLAIVVLLVAVSATMVLDLSEEREPAPNVAFELETREDGVTHVIYHEGGSTLEGDKVTVQGIANPAVLEGQRLSADDTVPVIPVDDEIRLVYTGEHGTSYTLWTAQPETSVPAPDRDCRWVDDETDGGNDAIKVRGEVVNCDLETEELIELQDGARVIGEVFSESKELDADDSDIYGDVNVKKVLNVQNGSITGSAVSRTADVKIADSIVDGTITGRKVVEITDGSTVKASVQSETKNVKVLSSRVDGSVTAEENVKVQDSIISGNIYMDDSNLDCENSTINGQSCSEYTSD